MLRTDFGERIIHRSHSTADAAIPLVAEIAKSWEPALYVANPASLGEVERARHILVSYFFSIGTYEKEHPNGQVVFAASFSEPTSEERIGTLALVLRPPTPQLSANQASELSERVQELADEHARRLWEHELMLMRGDRRASVASSGEEDQIRLACFLPTDMPAKGAATSLSTLGHWYTDKLRAVSTTPSDDLVQDSFFAKVAESVGSSWRFQDFVERVSERIEISDKPTVIFLFSEPGTGKERVAMWLHALYQAHRLKAKQTCELIDTNDEDAIRDWTKANGVTVGPRVELPAPNVDRGLGVNYGVVNCATLVSHEFFAEGLFGNYSRTRPTAGALLVAHYSRGTVFLDEFNTLPEKPWANSFLRVLEEPYECPVLGRPGSAKSGIHPLIVVASNRSRAELIRDGFNEAVVYRITKNYFEVPPLRQRRVDIAIYVNDQIARANRPPVKSNYIPIRRIASDAMTLLCELPWPDNYRGLKAVLDEVLDDRRRREIKDETLTFDAVIEAVGRRELFLATGRKS